jgi:hypothetical protein
MTDVVAVTVSLNPPVEVELLATGPEGPAGPAGGAGLIGPTGILATIRGIWASGTTYTAGPPPDAVLGSDGHWYVSLVSGNVGHDPVPDAGVHWADQLPASASKGIQSLVYSSGSYPARPAGLPAGRVQYQGPSTATPSDALSGDLWLKTS